MPSLLQQDIQADQPIFSRDIKVLNLYGIYHFLHIPEKNALSEMKTCINEVEEQNNLCFSK